MSDKETMQVESIQAPLESGTESPTAGEQTEGEQEGANTADVSQTANKEAAKYRRQLREVQAERDQLSAQVEAMQRAQVERALKGKLEKPSSFWLSDHKPADFYTEGGELDSDKLNTAADTAIETIGLARARRFQGSAGQGVRQSTPVRTTKAEAWQKILQG